MSTSFNTALSSGNYDTLRGASGIQPSYYSWLYLSLCPNIVKLAAQINQASFASSYATITIDTITVGAYTDVKEGMTVIIVPTANIAAVGFRGRIRANNAGVVSTATTLNINETSFDIADNWYVYVIDDYALWDKLGRQVGATQFKDYDHTFIQLRPLIYGLKSAYAGWVAAGVLTLSFAPSATAANSGATISTWAWNVGDGTITVGSSSTQNITATFPAGFRWVTLTVTDNGSRTATRRFPVFAHDPSTYPPQLLTAEQFQVTKNIQGGVDASVTAFSEVAGILDNTLVVAWNEEAYQDGTTALTGDNIAFVGRFRQSSDTGKMDEQYSLVTEAQYTIEGTLTQLARFEQLPYEFLLDNTPTAWDQIKNLTLWRAIAYLLSEHTTVLELHSLSFDSTADTYLVDGLRTQPGNMLSAVNDLAISMNAALQANCAGVLEVVRDAVMLSTSERNALVTVANWGDSDLLDLTYTHPDVQTIGRLKATGGAYNSAADNFATFESLAPGVAQNYPEGSANLERQVLTANATAADAQTELNTRAGNALAKAQEIDTLTVRHPDGYHWLIPSRNQWYTFTLSGSETTRGVVLTTDTRWLLTSVTVAHDSTQGSKDVQAIYVRETVGTPGQTVTYPPIVESPLQIPDFPPFPPFPAFQFDPSLFLGTTDPQIPVFTGSPNPNQAIVPANGDSVGIVTAVQDWITQTFISKASKPQWVENTPTTGLTIVDIQFDKTGGKGAYILVRVSGAWAHSFDFKSSNGGWAALDSFLGSGATASYSGGTGWTQSDPPHLGFGIGYTVTPGTVITQVNVTQDITGTPVVPGWVWSDVTNGGGASSDIFRDNSRDSTGTATYTDSIHYTMVHGVFAFQINTDSGQTNTVSSMTIAGTGTDPFGSSGAYAVYYTSNVFSPEPSWSLGAIVAGGGVVLRQTATAGHIYLYDAAGARVFYSSDYGATFSAPLTTAATPGAIGGADTQKIGSVSLVAADGQVYKNTTNGGMYAAYGSAMPASAEPTALFVPSKQFGGTTANTGSNPQYLVASAVASSAHSVWKVTASGATFTNITPTVGGNPGLAGSANCVAMAWYNGSRIAAILSFGGTLHLVTSTNAGSSWTDRGALTTPADGIQFRKGDTTMNQLFWIDGDGVGYSPDFGTTIVHKQYPSTDALVSLSVYG